MLTYFLFTFNVRTWSIQQDQAGHLIVPRTHTLHSVSAPVDWLQQLSANSEEWALSAVNGCTLIERKSRLWLTRRLSGREVSPSWLKLDFRGFESHKDLAAFVKHWAWGWKRAETWSGGMKEQSGQGRTFRTLTAPQQRGMRGWWERRGRNAGVSERSKVCSWRARLLHSDRGEGVEKEGFNEKSMMIRTNAVAC